MLKHFEKFENVLYSELRLATSKRVLPEKRQKERPFRTKIILRAMKRLRYAYFKNSHLTIVGRYSRCLTRSQLKIAVVTELTFD